MTMSIVVIVVAMALAVGFTGMCSFEPGKPENGPVQEVDAKTFLDMESRAMAFPVRYPEMPEGWVTNSARRSMIAGEPAPVVGWITPDEGYIQLTQTDVAADKVVDAFDGKLRQLDRDVEVGGKTAKVYTSDDRDVRPLWVVDLGDVRLLLTGAGSEEEYTQLIDATISATPLNG